MIVDGSENELLRLRVRCPRCGTMPALRITRAALPQYAELKSDLRIATYQCHRAGCGRIYDLTARAFQEAA